MYISGIIDPGDNITLWPVYRQIAQVRTIENGSHYLNVLGRDGELAVSVPFTPYKMADSNGYRGFGFFIPAVENATEIRITQNGQVLASARARASREPLPLESNPIQVQLAEDAIQVRWGGTPRDEIVHRVRLSTDGGKSWQVISIDRYEIEIDLPVQYLVRGEVPLLEIQATDGVRVATRVLPLDIKR
jgi:hypothetical protein